MSIKTVFYLMAEHGTAHIPLEKACKQYLDIDDYRHACRLAAQQKLPFKVFRAGGNKGPWLVHVEDLAQYLDGLRQAS